MGPYERPSDENPVLKAESLDLIILSSCKEATTHISTDTRKRAADSEKERDKGDLKNGLASTSLRISMATGEDLSAALSSVTIKVACFPDSLSQIHIVGFRPLLRNQSNTDATDTNRFRIEQPISAGLQDMHLQDPANRSEREEGEGEEVRAELRCC